MFPVHRYEDATVVELCDVPCCGEERARCRVQLVRLAREGRRLVLSCKQVRFFGASFLGLLLTVRQSAGQPDMVLCDLPLYGREVLEITGLDQVWPVCATITDARTLLPFPTLADASPLASCARED